MKVCVIKIFRNKKKSIILKDIASDCQFGFQDPATAVMEAIIDFHHDIMFYLIWIIIFIIWTIGEFIIYPLNNSYYTGRGEFWCILPKKIQHNSTLEIIWTTVPGVILLLIAIPSFSLLYSMQDLTSVECTIKIIGHQWYWSYEIPGHDVEKKFDSSLLPEKDLKIGQFRLLEVDNRLVLPVEKHIRFFITASDVLHSFAVPSLGIKMDACPGRINQISIWIKRTGIYYGQCSEICGVNHAFMPIVIEAVDDIAFISWISTVLFLK